MESETTPHSKSKEFELSDVDEDADIEVVTEVNPKEHIPVIESLGAMHEVHEEIPITPEATKEEEDLHERRSSWSGIFLKRMGSLKKDNGQQEQSSVERKRSWSKENETLAKFKASAVNTLTTVGTKFNEGGSYLLEASKRTAQATAENLKKLRFYKTPIEAICQGETMQRPCPRLLLVCCTAIASSGLSTEDIFRHDAPEELVRAVLAHFAKGNGAVLPQIGATPDVLATVTKRFLNDLAEPLLTYRLCEEWIDAGYHPQLAKEVMERLPPANYYSFDLLLDCLSRIASNSAENQMDAESLAQSLAPSLLWKIVKPTTGTTTRMGAGNFKKFFSKNGRDDSEEMGLSDFSPMADSAATMDSSEDSDKGGPTKLNADQLQTFVHALSYLISNHRTF